jgi:hypothetical protein
MAQTYPPTKAGLEQLVADDAAMLPPARAVALKQKVENLEKLNIKCYHYPNGKSNCYPEPKDFIAQIEAHIFKINGFVIDSDEWKVSIPSDNSTPAGLPDEPVELDQNFPDIVSPVTPQTRQFNEAVKQFGLVIWSEFGGPPRANPEEDGYTDVTVDYSPNIEPVPGVISIEFSAGNSHHGAADGGEYDSFDFNWDVAENRPVKAGDIFDETTDWKNGLADAVNDYFRRQTYLRGVEVDAAIVSDPYRWALLQSGLRVDGAFGGHSQGETSALITWAALKPYLKKGGLVSP